MSRYTRRQFITSTIAGCAGIVHGCAPQVPTPVPKPLDNRTVITISELIPAEGLGYTLPFEQLFPELLPASDRNGTTYTANEIYRTVVPILLSIKQRGIRTVVDSTPPFQGRDPELLSRISRASGLNIVAATGADERSLDNLRDRSVDDLADEWVSDINDGMGNTDYRAGFILCPGVTGNIDPVRRTCIMASIHTCRKTGALIAVCGGDTGGTESVLDLLEDEGIPNDRIMYVHRHPAMEQQLYQVLRDHDVWITYDNINAKTDADDIMDAITGNAGNRVMLSHGTGFYVPGRASDTIEEDYEFFLGQFLPGLQQRLSESTVDRIMMANPGTAFGIPQESIYRPDPDPETE